MLVKEGSGAQLTQQSKSRMYKSWCVQKLGLGETIRLPKH